MRQVWVLAVAQTFATAGTMIFITYGGILGTELAPRQSLATLPIALAGPIVLAQGWEWINLLALPVLAAMLVGIGWGARNTALNRFS